MIKPVKWATRLELLPEQAIRSIHEASLEILERTGLILPLNPARQEQARDLGLRLEGETQRVRFPPEVVEAAVKVAPREVLHALLGPKLYAKPGEPDLVIVRLLAKGRKDGRAAQAQVELIDRFDEATGFTAMQRTSGWDASIKAIMNAQGVTRRGVNPAEIAVAGRLYAEELRRRGFNLAESITTV